MRVESYIVHEVHDSTGSYIRFSENHYIRQNGNEYEPVYDDEDIEEAFQKHMQEKIVD